ncbi:MAG: inositol monophosphatase family protein [Myxococcota bacterium]
MTAPSLPMMAVARDAAEAAAVLLREAYARGDRVVEHKGRIDLVTDVDRACEAAIRAVLTQHTPQLPTLGEEEGGPWAAPTRWVVDPLDGTTNFVHGFPWFAVSIALEVQGATQVGVVLQPITHDLYAAERGQGATHNGRVMRVSTVDDLDHALVATGFPYSRRSQLPELLAPIERVLGRVQGLRRAGAAALDLAMVAAGKLDAYWERELRPWDLAAGRLLVTEAGGRVTAHDGSAELDPKWPGPLASNGRVHEAMVQALR